jgi:hypothetical protein
VRVRACVAFSAQLHARHGNADSQTDGVRVRVRVRVCTRVRVRVRVRMRMRMCVCVGQQEMEEAMESRQRIY